MKSALAHFQTLPLKDAARQLLARLGYQSDKFIAGAGSSPQAFLDLFGAGPAFDPAKALVSYNEETKTTARKQTGSFYTPRPIVDYMVDESIKAHRTHTIAEKAGMNEPDARAGLDLLFAYTGKKLESTIRSNLEKLGHAL